MTAAALSERPDVREAKLKVTQAQDAVKSKKAEFLPDVSLIARVIGMDNVGILPTQIVAVGVFGTWEPFDWGRKRAEDQGQQRRGDVGVARARGNAGAGEARHRHEVPAARRGAGARARAQLARDAAAEKSSVPRTRGWK